TKPDFRLCTRRCKAQKAEIGEPMHDTPPKNQPETERAFLGGGRIDETRPFKSVNIAVLTISDTRDLESDTSGDILARRIEAAGHHVAARELVRDDVQHIRTMVKNWIGSKRVDAIVTTGGTGITGRDVTPEAIEPLLSKKIE